MNKQNSATNSGKELDSLLSRWGVRHALPASKADSIRAAVLSGKAPRLSTTGQTTEPSVDLPYGWWERFYADLTVSFHPPATQRGYDQAVLQSLLYTSILPSHQTAYSTLPPG